MTGGEGNNTDKGKKLSKDNQPWDKDSTKKLHRVNQARMTERYKDEGKALEGGARRWKN